MYSKFVTKFYLPYKMKSKYGPKFVCHIYFQDLDIVTIIIVFL